jgi:ribosomal-protein-alanine N-acetyltransferase
VKLDPAMWGDAPDMAEVHAACFDDPWSVDDIRALLAGLGDVGLVVRAPASQAIVAFVLARIVADEAEVQTLAVDPAYRRLGLGQALMEAVAIRAAGAGAKSVFLEVASDNDAALKLYAAMGFTQVGRRPSYYRGSDGAADALVLRRDLNKSARLSLS